MLLHADTFLFLFFPLVFGTFLDLEERKQHRELALAWLVIASWFFYARWPPVYLFLLLLSILFWCWLESENVFIPVALWTVMGWAGLTLSRGIFWEF